MRESVLVADRYQRIGDWAGTRTLVREENLLQVRTAAAALRISKEVVSRLEHLSAQELGLLVEGSQRDRGYLLWSAACRRYTFICDFANDVLREHYLTLRYHLPLTEFNAFFNRKSAEHDEVENTALSTQNKLRQNLFRMMREAELLSEQYIIQPAMLSPRLAKLLVLRGHASLTVFPAADIDIARALQ